MRFWDASAIIPLCVNEPRTDEMRALLGKEDRGVFWWATPIECWSAFARLGREGGLDEKGEGVAREQLLVLTTHWPEILATDDVKRQAGLLLRRHPLRAADSLQLAAALQFFGRASGEFVTLDTRLTRAAASEGLIPVPAN